MMSQIPEKVRPRFTHFVTGKPPWRSVHYNVFFSTKNWSKSQMRNFAGQSSSNAKLQLHVVQVIRSAGAGGVESHVATLIRSLHEAGATTTLVSLADVEPEPLLVVPGVTIWRLSDEMTWSWKTLVAFFQLCKLLRNIDCDVVHCHGARPILLGTLAAVASGKKHIVSSLHGASNLMVMRSDGGLSQFRDWIARVVHGIGFWLSDRVLVCASRLKTDALSCMATVWPLRNVEKAEKRIVLIYQGIELKLFLSSPPAYARNSLQPGKSKTTIGTLSRLDEPKKGIRYLLEAVAILQRQGHKVALRVAGEGHSRTDLMKQAQTLGLADCEFLGFVSDAVGFYRGLDIFVLASLSEGMPLVLLEAMALGLPAVTTDVGGASEAVKHDLTGLVVPPRDAEKLAGAIARLVGDTELAATFGRAGRDRVESFFSSERMCAKILDVYVDIARQKASAP